MHADPPAEAGAPVFSVCLPVGPGSRWLGEALRSVAAQHEPRWELLVVLDGACDDNERVVARFAAASSQPVRVERNASPLGPSAARNRAAAIAGGALLAFIDADDEWLPAHLAALLATHTRATSGIVYSGVLEQVAGTGAQRLRVPGAREQGNLLRALYYRCCLLPSAVAVERQLFLDAGGFDAGRRWAEDLDLWLKLLAGGAKATWTGEVTCRYRRHPASLSGAIADSLLGRAQVLDRHRHNSTLTWRERRVRRMLAWFRAGRALSRENRPSGSAFVHALAAVLLKNNSTRNASRTDVAGSPKL